MYHLMHGRSWVAIVLDTSAVKNNCKPDKLCREYVIVHMLSGTEYEYYFERCSSAARLTNSKGRICYHWLRKVTDVLAIT